MLPRAEIENLLTAVFEAVDLAAEGHVADGYGCCTWAGKKALEGEQHFEEWVEQLEGRWDAALERYAARYGVGPSVTEPRQVTFSCGTAAPLGSAERAP